MALSLGNKPAQVRISLKRAIDNAPKKPVKVFEKNHLKLSKAASQNFLLVVVEIGKVQPSLFTVTDLQHVKNRGSGNANDRYLILKLIAKI